MGTGFGRGMGLHFQVQAAGYSGRFNGNKHWAGTSYGT